uniref:Uncharacterized protein n=1 Tax=Branchiostoma floridae TaxID=7739 RepID=C3YC78_BRAFL|eukprot:XP_002606100.1 hypothetical protein BRAFLDRAFT_125112 [Branchiostoma floridae]
MDILSYRHECTKYNIIFQSYDDHTTNVTRPLSIAVLPGCVCSDLLIFKISLIYCLFSVQCAVMSLLVRPKARETQCRNKAINALKMTPSLDLSLMEEFSWTHRLEIS